MILDNHILEDERKFILSNGDIIWSEDIFTVLRKLSTAGSKLSSIQIELGEQYLDLFLKSNCNSYGLLNGKSGLIVIVSLYIFGLSSKKRVKKANRVIEKIISEKTAILTESSYNDLSTGRIGLILSLSLLYKASGDQKIIELINEIYRLVAEDARFLKEGLAWMFSDLNGIKSYNFGNNLEIFLGLLLINKIHKSSSIAILVKNIVFEKNGQLISKKFCSVEDMLNSLNYNEVDSRKKIEKSFYKLNKTFYQNNRLHMTNVLKIFYFLWNEPIVNVLKSDPLDMVLKPEQIIYILLKSNFPECSDLIINNLLFLIKRDKYSLQVNNIMSYIKNIATREKDHDLIYFIKTLKFKIVLINKSQIFYKHNKINQINSINYEALSILDIESFFDIKLSINKNEFYFDTFSSTWIFERSYSRKKIIGCFRIHRFDKSVFLENILLDGILIRFFIYINSDKRSMREFKESQLTGHTVNYNSFKNRILYLIYKGVLIPCI